MSIRFLLGPLVAATSISFALPPWGGTGHRVVARLAESRLTPTARARVRDLLGNQSMAEVASWADSVRPGRPVTAPYHYVNIPIAEGAFNPARHCPGGDCVIVAIEYYRRVLADPGAPRGERAEALKYLIHFVGDLHQPLHAGDNHDRGGNDIQVSFLGRQSNLHRVWDSQLLESMGAGEEDLVGRLGPRVDVLLAGERSGGAVAGWAMESHDRARDHAYGTLPASRILSETYGSAQASVVEEALALAAARLARLLNDALQGTY